MSDKDDCPCCGYPHCGHDHGLPQEEMKFWDDNYGIPAAPDSQPAKEKP